MAILLFLLILVALVVIHELGHFAVAKLSGIRVDEFGFGFPPKLWGKRVGETEYTLNALPFGGFVRIFGENAEEASKDGGAIERSFTYKPKLVQAAVLIAGIVCNVLFAWVLFSAGFMIGMPVSSDYQGFGTVKDLHTVIVQVVANSPAAEAGLAQGDRITALSAGNAKPENLSPETVQAFINDHQHDTLSLSYERAGVTQDVSVHPQTGIVSDRAVLGISMDAEGVAVVPVYEAPIEGAKLTWRATGAIVSGLGSFFAQLFTGHANFSDVTGPVGLVGVVGSAASYGIVSLLSLIALISINLAVVNLIPFPALDGGRLLFVVIEAVKGSPIRAEVAGLANMAGFALLILLMLLVTYHDILRLFA